MHPLIKGVWVVRALATRRHDVILVHSATNPQGSFWILQVILDVRLRFECLKWRQVSQSGNLLFGVHLSLPLPLALALPTLPLYLSTKSIYMLSGPMRDYAHIAQYPFEIVSQKGVSHAFCLVFIGYRASIAEIPLLWGGGGIAPPLRMLSKGETLRKWGGGIALRGHVETP